MANTVDTTSLANALKRYYTPKRIGSLIFEDAPLLAMLPKNADFVGSLKAYPVRVSEAQLATSDVSQASTNSTLATSIANLQVFHMNVVEKHAWATISHKAMMESRNDKGAFLKAGLLASEDAILSMKKQIGSELYRAGWGKVGVIAANGISNATIQLTNVDDTANFYKGTQIVFADSESGHDLRNDGGSLVVSAVDRDAGTITCTANVSTLNEVEAGDVIFIKGNREDSATPTRRCIAGLDAWLPSSAPASNDSFFNVNRSSDSLLSGCRVQGSLSSIEDSLIDGALQVARRGGKLDVYMVSFGTYGALLKNASSQVMRDVKVEAKGADISFEAVALNTPKGKVKIVPDYFCPDDAAYGLQLNTWELISMGELIGQFDADGLSSSRLSDSNGIQIRYFSFPNLVCIAPGFNVRVALS